MYNNELKHYGVLGMKWGIRKADRLSSKNKKSRALSKELGKNKTSRVSRIRKKSVDYGIKKRTKKLNDTNFKLDMYGKATRKKVKDLSTLSAIGQTLVLGPYGALKYNQLKANNISNGKAFAYARIANIGNRSTRRGYERLDYSRYKRYAGQASGKNKEIRVPTDPTKKKIRL